jgi:DNA-binding NtrC family response regulator
MKPKVLLVDDEKKIIESLGFSLKHQYEVLTADSVESAQQILSSEPVDVVVTDLTFHGQPKDGFDLIDWLQSRKKQTPVIVLSGEGDVKRVISAQRRITDDYLIKPVDLTELFCAIEKARTRAGSEVATQRRVPREVITQDFRIKRSLEDIEMWIRSDTRLCALISGESGSGKEEVAKFAASVRGGPLVSVNMAAVAHDLQESELFGHTKGAFTGATSDRIGKFQAAHGGVLFLDEIGDCPLDLQVLLLRAIQEREVTRVGSNVSEKIDVKIITASNLDLRKLVADGKFREELLYRLEGVHVALPALRDRRGDIPLLVGKFIHDGSPKARPATITPHALRALEAYAWPGNVRELKTAVEVALLRSGLREIDLQHLPPKVLGQPAQVSSPKAADESAELNLDRVLRDVEILTFKKAIQKARGSRKRAFLLMGISESRFFRRARELKLFSGDSDGTEETA